MHDVKPAGKKRENETARVDEQKRVRWLRECVDGERLSEDRDERRKRVRGQQQSLSVIN